MKFENNFKKSQREIQERISEALEEVGTIVECNSKSITPVDTGKLRRSIMHFSNKNQVVVGTDIPYSEYVHNGTSKQASQPFLLDGAYNSIAQIKEAVKVAFEGLSDE